MGAQQEEEGPKGAPEWVVTFTDMISLLVTFFVLLMTYSSLEPRDFVKIGSLLDSSTGVLKNNQGDIAPTFTEKEIASNQDLLRGGQVPHSRPPEYLHENLEEMGQQESPDHQPVDLSQMRDGLRLRFDSDCSFEPGSAEVSDELRKSLVELGEVLRFYSFLVVVEGFTDSHFQPTPGYPTADVLSLHRARNAARVLMDEADLSPELVQLAGLGAASPRANNLTPEGRRMNRRVQVRVMALSTTRAAMLEAQREAGWREDR